LGSATTQEIDRLVHLDQSLRSQVGVVGDPTDMSHKELLDYFHTFYNVIMTTARDRLMAGKRCMPAVPGTVNC